MKALEERILREGKVFPGEVLKVDCFLNHQIDPVLIGQLADEYYRLFKDENVTKILTIEASGIAIAIMTAARFGVPMVFAKKSKTKNIAGDVYTTPIFSYTHGTTYDVMVSKDYLKPDDRVLIIDDFLAVGKATAGLIEIVKKAGAELVGVGIAIEKGFQCGGAELRARGIHLESLAIVESMSDDGTITFRKN